MSRILDYCCYTTCGDCGITDDWCTFLESIDRFAIFYIRYGKSPLLPRACGAKCFQHDDMHIHGPVRGEKWCSSDPGVPCNEDGRITQLGEYVKEYLNYFIIFDNIRRGHDAEIMNIRDFRGNVRVELCFSKYRHLSGISLEQGDEVSFSSHFGNWI